jgi:hypothetical protein
MEGRGKVCYVAYSQHTRRRHSTILVSVAKQAVVSV